MCAKSDMDFVNNSPTVEPTVQKPTNLHTYCPYMAVIMRVCNKMYYNPVRSVYKSE